MGRRSGRSFDRVVNCVFPLCTPADEGFPGRIVEWFGSDETRRGTDRSLIAEW